MVVRREKYVKKISLTLNVVFLFLAAMAFAQGPPITPPGQAKKFPTLDEQLKNAHATPGSELDKLIRKNQDFDSSKTKTRTIPSFRRGSRSTGARDIPKPTTTTTTIRRAAIRWF